MQSAKKQSCWFHCCSDRFQVSSEAEEGQEVKDRSVWHLTGVTLLKSETTSLFISRTWFYFTTAHICLWSEYIKLQVCRSSWVAENCNALVLIGENNNWFGHWIMRPLFNWKRASFWIFKLYDFFFLMSLLLTNEKLFCCCVTVALTIRISWPIETSNLWHYSDKCGGKEEKAIVDVERTVSINQEE